MAAKEFPDVIAVTGLDESKIDLIYVDAAAKIPTHRSRLVVANTALTCPSVRTSSLP